MNTGSLTQSMHPQYSTRASTYFVQLVEDIGRYVEPTATQLETLERSYRSTGEFLVNCPELEGLLIDVHPQGSRELGTMTRPLHQNRDGFDIDLVARLDKAAMNKYGGPRGPALLLSDLFAALQRYADRHNLKLQKWERCATLEYADGMCADIAPIIDAPSLYAVHGELHGNIPDRELRQYHPTNPRGFAKAFDTVAAISPVFTEHERLVKAMDEALSRRAEIVPLSKPEEVFGRLLCRFIQVIKLHRNISFGPATNSSDLAPSSIFLTSLAASAYAIQAPRQHSSPLDLLLDIVETMPQHFTRGQVWGNMEEWKIENPTAPGDNLASTMNTRARQKAFLEWRVKLVRDLENLFNAIESRAGVDQVNTLIETAFGPRAASAVQNVQLQRQGALRQAGRAAIVTATGMSIPTTSRAHTFFGGTK
jgi:hypothetical protein